MNNNNNKKYPFDSIVHPFDIKVIETNFKKAMKLPMDQGMIQLLKLLEKE